MAENLAFLSIYGPKYEKPASLEAGLFEIAKKAPLRSFAATGNAKAS
jgi:hypothetical protein